VAFGVPTLASLSRRRWKQSCGRCGGAFAGVCRRSQAANSHANSAAPSLSCTSQPNSPFERRRPRDDVVSCHTCSWCDNAVSVHSVHSARHSMCPSSLSTLMNSWPAGWMVWSGYRAAVERVRVHPATALSNTLSRDGLWLDSSARSRLRAAAGGGAAARRPLRLHVRRGW
jgi:hypothetical protein